jgi:ABC-type proline/glycine betaine transport system ATPase subunit
VPSLGNLGSGISIISHGNVFKVGCISDIVNIPEPNEIIALFEKNLDTLLEASNKKNK